MLNVMRKHAGSWMIKVILFAIVIVFVFWGVGSFRSRDASKVASVNGEIISMADYRRVYNNLIDRYRQQFGDSLNDGMIEMLQLERQAIDQLVSRMILLQEAEKLDLRVSDDEIAESIINTPVFQNNGSFDNRRYRSILSQVHLTPEEYEADQKKVLLGEKLTRIIMGAAKVSEAEVRQWYEWQNTTVNVDYISIDPDQYTDIAPSAEEITAYFNENKENYKTEPKVDTRYVVFDPDNEVDQVTVEADEIADYYDSNIEDFETAKTVEARHILIKLDPGADDKADAAGKARAEEIAEMARGGQDFAELAKTHSEGPSRDQGGYLGKFQQGQMVKPFSDMAFSLSPGEISVPVKTQFGWHIIKVESVEEASTRTLEESREEIITKLTERKARSLAYDKAEQFYEACFDKDDLIKNAKTFGLEVMETESFDRSGPEALGDQKSAYANAAFSLDVDEISDIQDLDGRYYLIQVTEKIDAAVPELEAVKPNVEKDLIEKMKSDRAQVDAQELAAQLRQGKPFDDVAADFDRPVKNTGFFGRNATIPEIGSDSQFSQAAFQLLKASDTSNQPIKGNAGFYLLRLNNRQAPGNDGYEAEKETIESRLLQQKQAGMFSAWMEARKNESEIIIEDTFLE